MPEVGAFVVGFVQGVGANLGISSAAISYTASAAQVAGYTAGASTLGTLAATTAATTAVSMAATAVAMDNMNTDPAPGTLNNVLDPMPASRTIYGETKTGGVIVFAKATKGYTTVAPGGGTKKNQILNMVIELAGHPCEDITQIYLGNTALNPVQVSASNPVAEGEVFPSRTAGTDGNGAKRYTSSGTSYDGQIGMKIYTGAQLLADKDLIDATTVQNDTDKWTTDHIGYDKTYVYFRLHFKSTLFRGIPQFTFQVKGKKVSFLGGAASYSTNPIKCLYDYMTTDKLRGGFGVSASDIDSTSWTAAAATCDDVIDIRPGVTQTRYFCGGIISSGQEPQEIMRSLLDACAGVMEWVNGKWYAWAYEADDIVAQTTITESELIDFPDWQLNRSSKDAPNSIKPVIRSTETAWQPSNVESVEALRKLWGQTSGTLMTVTNHGLEVGDRVKFVWWTGTAIDNDLLPSGLTAETYYYVKTAATNTFTVSATEGGTAIDLGTSTGGELTALHDIYLSRDGERKTTERGFTMVNDAVMARRLSIIGLRQIRQEISGMLICKPGTAYSVPADLFVGDTIRILNNEMSFWEAVQTWSGSASSNDTISVTSHGMSNHDSVVLSNVSASTGLDNSRIYYVRDITTSTFKLAHYRGGTAIDILASDFGITVSKVQGKLFRVSSYKPVIQDGIFAIELGVRETATNIYDWTDDREIEPPIASGITVPTLYEVEDVTGFAAESGTDQLYQKKDGTVITRVKLSWDETTDEYIAASGKVEIQYKLSSDTTWLRYPDLPGDSSEVYIIDVTDGEDYDFRIRFRNAFGKEGDNWTTVSNHTVEGKTAAPNPPKSFTATYVDGGDRIDLQWTNPSDLDLSHTQIGRSISYIQGIFENVITDNPDPTPDDDYSYDTLNNDGYYPDGFNAVKTQTTRIAAVASPLKIFTFPVDAEIRVQFVFRRNSGSGLPTVYGYNSSNTRCTNSVAVTTTNGSEFIDLTVDDGTTAPGAGPCVGFAFQSDAGDDHDYTVTYFNSRNFPTYESIAEVPVGTTRGQTGSNAIQTWTDFPVTKGSSARTYYYQIKSVDSSGNISTATVRDDARVSEWQPVQNLIASFASGNIEVDWTSRGTGGDVLIMLYLGSVLQERIVAEESSEGVVIPISATGTYKIEATLIYPYNGNNFSSRMVYKYITVSTPIPLAEPDYYYVRP